MKPVLSNLSGSKVANGSQQATARGLSTLFWQARHIQRNDNIIHPEIEASSRLAERISPHSAQYNTTEKLKSHSCHQKLSAN